jgi:glycosyltransferase involved in cell wall biosynthesis
MNEAENIPWVFGRIPESVDEVILVDGYSTDDTIGVALRIRPETRVVRQLARGKGCALRAGFAAATGDYIVMIDADGSMDPAEVGLFVRALDNGYDFVKGSRYLPGGGSEDLTKLRNFGNYALKTSVNMLFLVPFTDLCYGYVAFRRICLGPLGLTSHGFEIETEMAIHAVKANLKIAEVPSNESIRRSGVSNLNAFRDGKRVLRTLVRERMCRRERPVVDWLHFPELHGSTLSTLNCARPVGVDVASISGSGEKRTAGTVLAEQDGIALAGGMRI